jgi:glycosyltransferase involved in cell wall biosynthesis
MMKVLHLIKTPVGATWALNQVEVLRNHGVEIVVMLPPGDSPTVPRYEACGCKVIRFDFGLAMKEPWATAKKLQDLRSIIEEENPDLVHSHFYITTLLMRLALRNNISLPRIYQVAGPLHLEHGAFRKLEIGLSTERDYWIGSSRCTIDHYLRSGVSRRRLFLSYYGLGVSKNGDIKPRFLRKLLNLDDDDLLIGNVSWMYAPKYYLGHTKGLKRHEDMIDALGMIVRQNPNVKGVFIGGAWNGAEWYENRLRVRAQRVAGNQIILPGPLPGDQAFQAWADYDVAIHVPVSENCGGVVEPLYFAVPTIASRVGGLPEVIIEGKTGYLVPPRNPKILAKRIGEVVSDFERARQMAETGKLLVERMFDVDRTAQEIVAIYEHVLDPGNPRPDEFNSSRFVSIDTNRHQD